jgi:hypothetical protein
MFQSDYISKKKILIELQEQSKLPPILTSQFYTNCVKYSIVNENIYDNTKYDYQQTPIINNTCPNFKICINTNLRPNRKMYFGKMFTNPRTYIKD